MQDPKPVKLSGEELERVKREIAESNLSDSTKSLINGLIQLCIWMQLKLENSKVSINKLKRLFFINTEKRGRNKNKPDNSDDKTNETYNSNLDDDTDDSSILTDDVTTSNSIAPITKNPGHGRLSANDYTNSETVIIPHPDPRL